MLLLCNVTKQEQTKKMKKAKNIFFFPQAFLPLFLVFLTVKVFQLWQTLAWTGNTFLTLIFTNIYVLLKGRFLLQFDWQLVTLHIWIAFPVFTFVYNQFMFLFIYVFPPSHTHNYLYILLLAYYKLPDQLLHLFSSDKTANQILYFYLNNSIFLQRTSKHSLIKCEMIKDEAC